MKILKTRSRKEKRTEMLLQLMTVWRWGEKQFQVIRENEKGWGGGKLLWGNQYEALRLGSHNSKEKAWNPLKAWGVGRRQGKGGYGTGNSHGHNPLQRIEEKRVISSPELEGWGGLAGKGDRIWEGGQDFRCIKFRRRGEVLGPLLLKEGSSCMHAGSF